MIVSHHGEYAYGSPKLPMTLEAITLHFLDNLDSKIHSVTQIINVNKMLLRCAGSDNDSLLNELIEL